MSIMTILEQGQVQKSFDDAALAAGDGTVFALPAQAVLVTWQTSFVTPPSAVDISIQTSLDNISWDDSANTTSTTGAIGSFVTSAIFIRAIVNSATDGDTFTVQLVSKIAMLSTNQQISGLIDAGQVAFGIAGNAIAGDANLTWDDTNKSLGVISKVGGGDHAIVIQDSNGGDQIILYADESPFALLSVGPNNDGEIVIGSSGNKITINGLAAGTDIRIGFFGPNPIMKVAVDGITMKDATASSVLFAVDATGIVQPSGYNSSDSSAGITQDVTTGTLVGKTMTFKDGLLVGFA